MASLLRMARAISMPAASVNKYAVSAPLYNITAKRNITNRGIPEPTKRRKDSAQDQDILAHEDRTKPWHMSGGHLGNLFVTEFPGEKPKPEDFGAEFQATGMKDGSNYPDYEVWSSEWRDPRPEIPYEDPSARRYFGEPVPMPYEAYHMVNHQRYHEKETKEACRRFYLFFTVALGIVWADLKYGLAGALEYREAMRLPNDSAYVLFGGDPDIIPTEYDIEVGNLQSRRGQGILPWK